MATGGRTGFGVFIIDMMDEFGWSRGMTTAIISAHYVPFAIDRGVSLGMVALAVGLMSGRNVVGVLAIGTVSDRRSRKNLLGTVYAVRGLAYL